MKGRVRLDYTGCLDESVGAAGLTRDERPGHEAEAKRLRRELKRPRAIV